MKPPPALINVSEEPQNHLDMHRLLALIPREEKMYIFSQYCNDCGEFLYRPDSDMQYFILNEKHICGENKETLYLVKGKKHVSYT